MRRIIFIGTAVVVLIAASVAVAATLNTYTAKVATTSKAGSKSHPVATSIVETLTAKNADSTLRAGALTDIKTTIYGLVSNAKKFPTCDGNKISAMKTDSFCPKKALIATGPVNAILGDNTLTGAGTPCNPFLHVWNGGGGKLWFFFTTGGKYQCAGLHTGDTNAYPGYRQAAGQEPDHGRAAAAVRVDQGRGSPELLRLPDQGSPDVQEGLQLLGGLQGRQAPLQRRLHGGWSVG